MSNTNLFPEEGSQSLPTPTPTPEEEQEENASKYALPKDKDEPPVIRELMQNAPESFKVPTFFAAATCLAGLATRIRAYYNGRTEEARR